MNKHDATKLVKQLSPKIANIEHETIPPLESLLKEQLSLYTTQEFDKWFFTLPREFKNKFDETHRTEWLKNFIPPFFLDSPPIWGQTAYSLRWSLEKLKIYKEGTLSALKEFQQQLNEVAQHDTNILFKVFQKKYIKQRVSKAKEFIAKHHFLIENLDEHIEEWSKLSVFEKETWEGILQSKIIYHGFLAKIMNKRNTTEVEKPIQNCETRILSLKRQLHLQSRDLLVEKFNHIWEDLREIQARKDIDKMPIEMLSIVNDKENKILEKILHQATSLGTLINYSIDALVSKLNLTHSEAIESKQLLHDFFQKTKQQAYPRLNPDTLSPLEFDLLNILKKYQAYPNEIYQKEQQLKEQIDNWLSLKENLCKLSPNRCQAELLSKEQYPQWLNAEYNLYEKYAFLESRFHEREIITLTDYNHHILKEDFIKNGASYFSIIEELTGTGHSYQPNDLPSLLVEEVSKFHLMKKGLSVVMRPYQEFGAKYALYSKKILLGDEMGLGKTIQAISIINHLHQNNQRYCIVVSPLSVLENWDREIKKWSKINVFIFRGRNKQDEYNKWSKEGGVLLTNYEQAAILNKCHSNLPLDFVVVDEAHYIKSPYAKRTISVSALLLRAEYKLLMTGTPLENRLHEMKHLIGLLNPALQKQLNDEMISIEEFKQKVSTVYLRRKRQEVLTELPEKDEILLWSSLTNDEQMFYDQAVASGPSGLMKMRRAAFYGQFSQKILQILSICKEAHENNQKVIIFSFFKEGVLYRLMDEIPSAFPQLISGDVSAKQRQEIIDEFSSESKHTTLLCQIDSGGVGLNIQVANIVILCEPQWKPSTEQQAISRVYRMGQTRDVVVYRLLTKENIDETMLEVLNNKTKLFNNYANDSLVANAFYQRSNTQEIDEKQLKQKVFEIEKQRLENKTQAS